MRLNCKKASSLFNSYEIFGLVLACLCAGPQFAVAAAANESVTPAYVDHLKIVPSLGYTYFNVQGSPTDYKSKVGSSAAVLVQMPLMDGQMEIESGLEYMETGAKQTLFGSGFFTIDATLDIKQVAIPIRAKYIFNPATSGTHYYGKAGITPTYVTSAKVDALGATGDVKSQLNDIGALTQAGLGADWGLDSITGRVSLDLTYSYGLTKVFKDSDGRATGYQLQAGYAFIL